MPVEFGDYTAKASGLFNDHHNAGSIAFAKSGKVGSGDATYELNVDNSVNGGPVNWSVNVNAGNFSMTHDHEGNISKKLDFTVKQVPGLSMSWEPAFSCAKGFGLGSLSTKYAHEKAVANFSLNLASPDNADFDVSMAPFKGCFSALNLGLKGNLSASGLKNGQWGFNMNKGDLELGFHSTDLNSQKGQGSIYKALPGNNTFCCYGVEASTEDNSLAIAAASAGCCSQGWRYKLDNKGTFSVAKNAKLNRSVGVCVSAAINATNMSAGGHSFGMKFSFE